jgi:hypothetical protein
MRFNFPFILSCCFLSLAVESFQHHFHSSSDTIQTGSSRVKTLKNFDITALIATRREYLEGNVRLAFIALIPTVSVGNSVSVNAESTVSESTLEQIKLARKQLEPVPELIAKEQWDGVRAVLLKPPLSDCWTKSAKKIPLLQQYAEAVEDELAALEMKEEIQSHLRYLDMAVYNNVFNPIKSTGTIGATKELIRSYYEDPMNEYKASIRSFDELLQLSSSVN